MTVYNALNYAQNQPAGTGHGEFQISTHLHAVSPALAALATGDTINFGYIPRNAVIVTVGIKAAAQLDSNATPTLTLDVGVPGTPQLFKAAITTVGRVAGASFDITNTGAGQYYLNASGAKQAVIATVHAGAATGVAGGTLELDVEYFVQDAVGSPA